MLYGSKYLVIYLQLMLKALKFWIGHFQSIYKLLLLGVFLLFFLALKLMFH